MNCEIDGKSFPAVQPASVEELRQAVRDAASNGQAIYPVGGRTMLDFGLPPARDGIAIDTTRLDRVIDYPSRDMTITVEAGIRIAKLQEILNAEGQRLPIDVPRAAEATLGGTIATNTSGPRRYGYGTFRDYVIGISVVDADGNETKAGGRVVKNVAGYDLCKLYTGSLGTLGIITQVTLKLRPITESTALVWHRLDSATRVAESLDRLNGSRTRPAAIELLNPPAAARVAAQLGRRGQLLAEAPWVLVVGFEENADAVRWQQVQLEAELRDLVATRELFDGDDAHSLWIALVEFQSDPSALATFKANFQSSATVSSLEAATREPIAWSIQAQAGNGIAYGHAGSPADATAVQGSLVRLRSLAVSLHGNLVLRRCPVDWKSQQPVWGEPRRDAWLMQSIKDKLDPQAILNPGRLWVVP